MIDHTVKITLAGFEKTIPVILLQAYENIGWRILGADPVVSFKKPKTAPTGPKRTKKESSK